MSASSNNNMIINFHDRDGINRDVPSIRVNIKSHDDAVHFISSCMRDNKGFCFATLNLDHIIKLRESIEFIRAYARHDAISADGFPIVWLGRMIGVAIDRTTGSDLVRPAIRVASELNRSISIVGTTMDTINAAEQILKREFGNLNIALKCSPPFGFDPRSDEAADIARAIIDSGCSLALVALGAPKQEMFVDFARGFAPHVGFISIGAGIDFISGKQVRAPEWMQDINLEWLWRLATEPRRLSSRYLKCLAIFPSLMRSAAVNRDIRVALRMPFVLKGRGEGLEGGS